jgi:tetratricopeptide (TPR) repeat protein
MPVLARNERGVGRLADRLCLRPGPGLMPKKYVILLLLVVCGAAGVAAWQYYVRRTPPRETIASLQALLKNNPVEPDLHERLAVLLAAAGQTSLAADHFQQAIQYAPERVSARCGLAGLMFAQGRPLEAQKLLETNLKLSLRDPGSNELLGEILMKTLGEKTPDVAYPLAARYFDTALQGDPTRELAALGLSRIFFAQGRLSDAAGALQKALAAHPKNAALHLQMARVLAVAKRYSQATDEYNQGTALDPQNSQALFEWGVMLIDSGRPVTAETVLRRAVELQPRNAQYHMHLGRALRDEGISIAGAMKEFEKAIDCDPNYAAVYLEIATTLLKANDETNDARAEKFLRQATAVDRKYTPAKIALARFLVRRPSPTQSQLYEAEDLLRQCVEETKEQDISLLVGYAEALANVKVYDLAVTQIEKAIAWGSLHGLTPAQLELLYTRRQNYTVAQMPEVQGDPNLLPLTVEGRYVHDPVEDPWPFPKQPTVKSLVPLPLDLAHPPTPGSLLDPQYFTGPAVTPPGDPMVQGL